MSPSLSVLESWCCGSNACSGVERLPLKANAFRWGISWSIFSGIKPLVHGKPVELTATEFKLLTTLAQRRGRVQTREKLLQEVWGYDNVIDTRTVDTHIRRLQEK